MTGDLPPDRQPSPRPRRQPDSSWAVKGRPSQDAFRILPADMQELMRLRFIEERSVHEIARILGKTPAQVKGMQSRALKKIQDYRERQQRQEERHSP